MRSRSDELRDYAFAERALTLRERARLTQRALGALLGISNRAIQAWESGLAYPATGRLERLISVYLEHRVFGVGGEEDEARALWEMVRARAARPIPPFDPVWFASLTRAVWADDAAEQVQIVYQIPRREDWGDAPAVPVLWGRADELETLTQWVNDEQCRVVTVLGMAGIGKTVLTAALAHALAPRFHAVYWRSLRNAPPAEEWLDGAIAALSPAVASPSAGPAARLEVLLGLMQERRALLVLDNLESVLEPGQVTARYRAGYEGYDSLLHRLREGVHRGCVFVTSRERPPHADDWDERAARSLRLSGLEAEEGRALLERRGLIGEAAAWSALVSRYAGNPLALHVVGETIAAVFAGDIDAFLAQNAAVFGDIRQVLHEQVARLSAVEQSLLTTLAVEREPVGFAQVLDALGPGVQRGEAMEAVEALQRRSLLERTARGERVFTLQPVVLEYATGQLVEQVASEILTGEPLVLASQVLLRATAKDYVFRSQERLILVPLLKRLGASISAAVLEQRLLALLERWRGRPWADQGYGPGNVVDLLRLLRGNLRNVDLSGLAIRQAYLQGVEAQDARLVGAHVTETALAEAFAYPGSVALGVDGGYLVAGTSSGEVRLWRVADRTPMLSIHGHSSMVWSVALSRDNRLIVSGGFDGLVRLWEVPSGHLRATLEGHNGMIGGIALSDDSRLVASGGSDGTVQLWDTESQRPLAILEAHSGPVTGVALSRDGRLLASGSQDGTLRLWEVPGGRLLKSVEAHAGRIGSVALSGDGAVLASGDQDGVIQLWDAKHGRSLANLVGHTGPVLTMAFSEDGHTLASGSLDGTVRLWDASSGRPAATIQAHTGQVWGVGVSGNGQVLASTGLDGAIRLWQATDGQPLLTLLGHAGGIVGVALSESGEQLASCSQDGTMCLWETHSGRLVMSAKDQTNSALGIAFTRNGEMLTSGSLDGIIRLREVPNGRLLATLAGRSSSVWCVSFSMDARLLAGGSQDGSVLLWEISSRRLLATLAGHTGPVYAVAFSTDGQILASGGIDQTIRLWDVPSRQLLTTLEGHTAGVMAVALSGDGHQVVASGSLDGTVRLWKVPSGQLHATLHGHAGPVHAAAFSGDGQVLASGGIDGTIVLWDVPDGRRLMTLRGHGSGVLGVAFSGDGQVLASGSLDGTVRLWDTRTGTTLRTMRAELPYERMDITGLSGVTEAQRTALLELGAVERPI